MAKTIGCHRQHVLLCVVRGQGHGITDVWTDGSSCLVVERLVVSGQWLVFGIWWSRHFT